MNPKFTIAFGGPGTAPKCQSDPAYPNGIDLDASNGEEGCRVELPYPAMGVGFWCVQCRCGATAACTTAGRPDDPRSIKIACAPIVVGEAI